MRILVADDDPISIRKLEVLLVKYGYDVVLAKNGIEAWEHLQSDNTLNLAIIDWMMPGMDGIDICKKVRRRKDNDYTYIILLTSKDTREDTIKGMCAGADDYITKPFDPQELKVRLRAGTRIIELQNNLIETREALRIRAIYDDLTGLLNRQEIIDFIQREFEKWKRESCPICIIMSDLDHFQKINDNYGHIAGDTVLREVSDRMKKSVRPYDRIGRYGGEEFIIVLSDINRNMGEVITERIRAAIADKPIISSEALIHATISMGLASSEEIHPANYNDLIRAADSALYRAKENGRNRIEISSNISVDAQ